MLRIYNLIDTLKELEWKRIFILAIIGIIFHKIIIELIIPRLFWNNSVDMTQLIFILSMQFLIYLCLGFYICRITEEHKFLHITFLAILGTVIPSIIYLIYFLVVSGKILAPFLATLYNLIAIIPIMIAGTMGFLSEKIYLKLMPEESPLFVKLCFPLAVFVSIINIIPSLYVPGPDPFMIFSAAPLFLLGVFEYLLIGFASFARVFILLGIPFQIGRGVFESVLPRLWILILYYTLLFFFIAYSIIKFKENRKFRWLFLIILVILFHLACMGLAFLMFAFAG